MTEPWWKKQGYLAGKEIGEDLWTCIANMITTWRIMICDEGSVHEFWCYPKGGDEWLSLAQVVLFWRDFDGTGDPPLGWVKHFPSMRRHQPVDYVNAS